MVHSAVLIEPLTRQQVETYLEQAGPLLAAVRTARQANPVLQELITTPLMLSVLMLTYAGVAVQDLPQHGSADEQQQQIFTSYVERMVMRKGDVVHYPLERTKAWLGWLAQQMRQDDQTIFYLERLQPDWLLKRQRAFYRGSVVLVVGLVSGLVGGLGYGLCRLVFGLVYEQGALAAELQGELVFGLVSGLVSGLVEGLVYGLVWVSKENLKIEPVEAITWSRESLVSELRRGLVVGLVFGLVAGSFFEQDSRLLVGLVVGLVSWLVFGLVSWLSKKQLTERSMLSPNEGIRRSIKNGLHVWLVVGLVVGLVYGLVVWLVYGPVVGLVYGLVVGLFGGLYAGLCAGLGAAMSHYTLRFWLWRMHYFPWKAVPFLEDATTRILLQRVGGGYRFVHRLILDYFADLRGTVSFWEKPNTHFEVSRRDFVDS